MLERPAPRMLDIKQRRIAIPETWEAKNVRIMSAPTYPLEKDYRLWCREGEPRQSRADCQSWGNRGDSSEKPECQQFTEQSTGEREHYTERKIPRFAESGFPSNILPSTGEQMRVRKLPKRIQGNSAWNSHRARNSACSPQPEEKSS